MRHLGKFDIDPNELKRNRSQRVTHEDGFPEPYDAGGANHDMDSAGVYFAAEELADSPPFPPMGAPKSRARYHHG